MNIKRLGFAFLFLNVLIIALMAVNLLPNKLIHNNLVSSITTYNNDKIQIHVSGIGATMDDASADSTELQIMNNNNPKRLLYSVFVTPAYRDFTNQDFITMSYKSIVEGVEPNYDYNRYWHGYQILWKPLLVFFNASQIRCIYAVIYILTLVYLLVSLSRDKSSQPLLIGLGLMNVFYIVPYGFIALEYIPVLMIMLCGCVLIHRKLIDEALLFYCLGIAAAFFDFWTAETLTLTVPLIMFMFYNQTKIKEGVFNAFRWLFAYCFTFSYKWIVSSIIFRENYIKRAIEKYETHESGIFGRPFGIKFNISRLFGDVFSVNQSTLILIMIIITILLLYYLFRRVNSRVSYIGSLIAICTIPYLEYFVCNGHSVGYSHFTYRAQLVLVLVFVLIISEIDIELFRVGKRSKLKSK